MKIAVIGAGYVGLVSGICFSDFGHDVVCVDKDQEKIDQLNQGQIPIYEPGLADLLQKNVDGGRLSFSTSLSLAMVDADAIFIAVGTPSRRGDGAADLSYVRNAVIEAASIAKKYILFITKSTVPVGTNRDLKQLIANENPSLEFDIASNPEFLREGSAIEDFQKPDRIIVGVESEKAKKIISEIYQPLYLRDFPILFTSLESSEIIKYASNAFLATKISFINEVAALCEKTGGDIKDVSQGMGLDGRIGKKFLHAGPGYGGSCFPKDTSALVETGKIFDVEMSITQSVINSNERTKIRMIKKIRSLAGGELSNKLITILGVTFKPNTDDMRDAPSLVIVPALLDSGAKIRIVDPQGYKEGSILLEGAEWHDDIYGAAKDSDMVVILTEWNEFRALDLGKLSSVMNVAAMADLRNIYSKEKALSNGFITYDSIGR
jgi:UDPglucose 6-dehydrogenase